MVNAWQQKEQAWEVTPNPTGVSVTVPAGISLWPLQLCLRASVPASLGLCCVTISACLGSYRREPICGLISKSSSVMHNTVDFSHNAQTSRDSIIWLHTEEK